MDEVLKDERFKHVFKDPKFRKIPSRIDKVSVDKRFKRMFKDKTFKEKYVMDKRGRPLNLTSSEDLKKLYDISSDEDEEDEEAEIQRQSKDKPLKREIKHKEPNDDKDSSEKKDLDANAFKNEDDSDSESFKSLTSKEEKTEDDEKPQEKLDKEDEASSSEESDFLSEEKVVQESEESSSEESSSEDEEGDEEFDHHWEELRHDAPDANEITRRLAVCNMDWDRIRAEDLFVAFDSFKPPGGCIHSVKIYPSEYGMKRMEEERLKGPAELVEETINEDEEEDMETSKYHREKLRQYQMNRLKYYYAVIDCDSPETATALYEQLNGMEYESSSVRFDIRFIPDDITFDQEPHSMADKIPDPTEYKPRLFVTTALQQVKVDLTWDETDPKRRETIQRAFQEPESIEKDIKDYLASSSSSEDEGSENENEASDENDTKQLSTKSRIEKYKALLQSLEEKEKADEEKIDMEITWEPGLKEKTKELVEGKLKKEQLTPFEEKLKKHKEQRKWKKKEMKAKTLENSEISEESDDDSFVSGSKKSGTKKKNLANDEKKLADLTLMMSDSSKIENTDDRKSKRKRKKDKLQVDDDFQCNVNDPRFAALYTSPLFNIDPSHPHFKATKGTEAIIQEKQKKIRNSELLPLGSHKKLKTST